LYETISVVIPAYDPGKYLLDALNSVYAQTKKPSEIIIIDDGSPTPLLLPDDFPISTRVIKQENSGQAVARNLGIQQAAGAWIAFLDADDVWHPQKLELQMQAAIEKKVQCVGCRAILVDELGNTIGAGPGNFSNDFCFLDRLSYQIESPKAVLVPSMALIEKKTAQKVGGFQKKYQPIEDLVFFDRVFSSGAKVLMLDRALLKRRVHGNSLTLQYRKMLRSYLAWIEDIIEPEMGKTVARRVKASAFFVTGLSALAKNQMKDSRILFRKSALEGNTMRVCLPFLFSCLGSRITRFCRSAKHFFSGKEAQNLW